MIILYKYNYLLIKNYLYLIIKYYIFILLKITYEDKYLIPRGKAYFKNFGRNKHIKILFLKNLDNLLYAIFKPTIFIINNIIIIYLYLIDVNINI